MLNGTDQIAWNSFVSGLNHGENGDKPTSHAKRIVNDQRDLVIVYDLHGALITERITNIFFQTFAISRIGLTLYLGFSMVSTNTALVFALKKSKHVCALLSPTSLSTWPLIT